MTILSGAAAIGRHRQRGIQVGSQDAVILGEHTPEIDCNSSHAPPAVGEQAQAGPAVALELRGGRQQPDPPRGRTAGLGEAFQPDFRLHRPGGVQFRR